MFASINTYGWIFFIFLLLLFYFLLIYLFLLLYVFLHKGNVCLNILREDWKPVLDINAVIYGMIYLFYEPNPDDPLNREASDLYRTDKAQVMMMMRMRMMIKMLLMIIMMMMMLVMGLYMIYDRFMTYFWTYILLYSACNIYIIYILATLYIIVFYIL